MAGVRHLENPPITEALVDFRVKANPKFRVKTIAELKDGLREQFPEVMEQRGFEAVVSVGEDKRPAPSAKDLGIRGYYFKSADGRNIIQFRIDGFTYNRLKPYTSWDEIFPFALKFWELYTQTASPVDITRLALRYINHIELPGAPERFEEIMTAPPRIPGELPQDVSRFLTRVTVHEVSAGVSAHVTQALERRPNKQSPALILDIDAFHQCALEAGDENSSAKIREIFGALRDFKNKIFFASLTEETIRGFE
jgi:uncharacterized protein (TIGR04255 family)